jgi:hypothetical protein
MRTQEAADFVKEVWEQIEVPNTYRIYVPAIGRFNVVYHDLEFKDFEEREKFWAAFFARPEVPEWTRKWMELSESGGGSELLRPVE